MSRFYCFCLVIFLFGAPALHAQHIDSVKAMLNQQRYADAEKTCHELIATQRSNAELHCLLGDIYCASNNIGNAILSYDRALVFKPTYGEAYAKRGYCHYMIKDLKSARLDLISASYYDRSAINYFNLGKVEQQVGKLNEALDSYAKALKKDSSLTDIYRYRSEIYMAKQKYAQALRDIDSSLKLSPFDDGLFVQRGTALLGMKKQRDAIQMFSRAIRLKHESPEAYYGRGRARYEIKDYIGAIADFDTCVTYDQSFHLAYFNRALARLGISIKNREDACSDFRKAASLSYTEALPYLSRYCE